MFSYIIDLIFSLSTYGSILAIVVLLLKPIVKNRISKQIQYLMWVIVLMKFLIPFSIQVIPEIPMYTLQNETFAIQSRISALQSNLFLNKKAEIEDTSIELNAGIMEEDTNTVKDTFALTPNAIKNFLLYLIPLGGIIYFLYFLYEYYAFCLCLKRTIVKASDLEKEILNELKTEYKIKKHIALYRSSSIKSPILLGLLKQLIIIPDITLNSCQIKNILCHELIHYKQKHIFIKWVTAVMVSVHWFNPVVYLVRREINKICELSCDELVIKNMNSNEKQSYGDTLIDIVEESSYQKNIVIMMVSEKKDLKERLLSIMNYKVRKKFVMFCSLVLVLVLSVCALTLGGTNSSDILANKTSIRREQLSEMQKNNQWADFPQKLKEGNYMPEETIDGLSDDLADTVNPNRFLWMEKNEKNQYIHSLNLQIRENEITHYYYVNANYGYSMPIKEISKDESKEKVLEFLKDFKNENPADLQIVDKGNYYNHYYLEIEKDSEIKYKFTVDTLHDAIVEFRDCPQYELLYRDIQLSTVVVENGRDYEDSLNENEIGLWVDLYTDTSIETEDAVFVNSIEELVEKIKLSKHDIYIPSYFPDEYKFEKAFIVYYTTQKNINRNKPSYIKEVQEGVELRVFEKYGDYRECIEQVFIHYTDVDGNLLAYRYNLTESYSGSWFSSESEGGTPIEIEGFDEAYTVTHDNEEENYYSSSVYAIKDMERTKIHGYFSSPYKSNFRYFNNIEIGIHSRLDALKISESLYKVN